MHAGVAGGSAPPCRLLAAFDLDPAVMQFDEAVDERKAQTRAGALARLALGREALEHIGLHLRRDARARYRRR